MNIKNCYATKMQFLSLRRCSFSLSARLHTVSILYIGEGVVVNVKRIRVSIRCEVNRDAEMVSSGIGMSCSALSKLIYYFAKVMKKKKSATVCDDWRR